MYSIVPTLRRLKAEGVPAERPISLVLEDALASLGRDGAVEWFADRLRAADRAVERVRLRTYAERIATLERRVAALEAQK